MLVEKAADAEMITQIACAMDRLIHHEPTRRVLLYETDAIPKLSDFLFVQVPVLVDVVSHALTAAMDWDRYVTVVQSIMFPACVTRDNLLGRDHGRKSVWRIIQAARFRAHNREWCAAALASAGGAAAREARHSAAALGEVRFELSSFNSHHAPPHEIFGSRSSRTRMPMMASGSTVEARILAAEHTRRSCLTQERCFDRAQQQGQGQGQGPRAEEVALLPTSLPGRLGVGHSEVVWRTPGQE